MLVGKTEVVSLTVDVIATDFGRIKVIPSRWLPPDIGLLLDADYWAVAFYRSFRQYLMARTQAMRRRIVVIIVDEWGVEAQDPVSSILPQRYHRNQFDVPGGGNAPLLWRNAAEIYKDADGVRTKQ